MNHHTAFVLAALFASAAQAQTSVIETRSVEVRGVQAMRGNTNIGRPLASEQDCRAAIEAYVEADRATRMTGLYKCRAENVYQPVVVTVCAAPRPPLIETLECPTGTTGSRTRTTTYAVGPAPQCIEEAAATTTGSCTPIPAPPPPPPAPPPPGAPGLFFSDCQTGAAAGCAAGANANPGTEASPKQNLSGLNLNALPAGTQLFFKRGGAWAPGMVFLDNPNTSATAPLTFDAYGTGPAPVLRQCTNNLFNLGGGWGNTSNDGGYTFRNLKLDGCGTGEWGVWFVQNVRDVVIENTEITGFRIAVNSNDGAPYGVSGITLRNNNIHHNRAMGLLGHYDNLLLEGNTIEANNFSGSIFDHGTYIGGGHNITLRNNRYVRNSTVNGTCMGGNMTFHGQIEGLLIEGNTIEQGPSAPSCYLMSITQGYTTAEWFRNTVVRNNTLVNGGSAIVAQSAPGILIEGNRVIRTQPITTAGISIGGQYAGGDAPDADAVVRDNVLCLAAAGAGGAAASVSSPGATVAGNVIRSGAEASTGPCAR